jgi:hypothetical protein
MQGIAKITAFRKSTQKKLGLFDESRWFDSKHFFSAGEDMDFGTRLIEAGGTMFTMPDIVKHKHPIRGAGPINVTLKEMQLGMANGAYKKKYGVFNKKYNLGAFDFEWRALCLLFALFADVISGDALALLFFSPFIVLPLIHAIQVYQRTGWILGPLFYIVWGPWIMLAQTVAAVIGFIKGKQTKEIL